MTDSLPDEPAGEAPSDPQPGREGAETGWLALARNESVARMIDALLDRPPHSQFTQTELAEAAGVSRQSVHRHLEFLLAIGVLEPVERTSPRRYTFDPESEVSEAIVRLDGAMNAAGPGPRES